MRAPTRQTETVKILGRGGVRVVPAGVGRAPAWWVLTRTRTEPSCPRMLPSTKTHAAATAQGQSPSVEGGAHLEKMLQHGEVQARGVGRAPAMLRTTVSTSWIMRSTRGCDSASTSADMVWVLTPRGAGE